MNNERTDEDLFPSIEVDWVRKRYAFLENDYEILSVKLLVPDLSEARSNNIVELILRPRNLTNRVQRIRITRAPDDPSIQDKSKLRDAISLYIEAAPDEDEITIPF